MVTIRDGRAAGSAIGMTFAGAVDRKAERVDLTGSLVPLMASTAFWARCPCWAIFSYPSKAREYWADLCDEGQSQRAEHHRQSALGTDTGHLPADFRIQSAKEPVAQTAGVGRTHARSAA